MLDTILSALFASAGFLILLTSSTVTFSLLGLAFTISSVGVWVRAIATEQRVQSELLANLARDRE